MRDVSAKPTTLRTARARAEVTAGRETLDAVLAGRTPKGDPLPVAKVAAIQAAKKTSEWIPFCHNIPIEHVETLFEVLDDRIAIEVTVTSVARTGVEMEAMTAAAAAALTIVDMLKMIDVSMTIDSIRLLEKTGGKSDAVDVGPWRAAIIVCSDRVAAGDAEDRSGTLLGEACREWGATEVDLTVVPDEVEAIQTCVLAAIASHVDVLLVTGGTGIGPRDRTPEAIAPLLDLPLAGIVEAVRSYGQARLGTSMLSRAVAGVAGRTIVITLPGSPGACRDAVAALFPAVLHAKQMLLGGGHP